MKTRKEQPHKPLKSSVVIARLLKSDGFTDHVANQVLKYWRNAAGLTERQKRQMDGLQTELSDITGKLTAGERMVIGRFFGLRIKAAFDTGLRIGLMTSLHCKDIEVEDD